MRQKNDAELSKIEDEAKRLDRLCELNVIDQVQNVCHTTIVQEAWDRGHALTVHGWIYSIQTGVIRDLEVTMTSQADIDKAYHVDTRPSS